MEQDRVGSSRDGGDGFEDDSSNWSAIDEDSYIFCTMIMMSKGNYCIPILTPMGLKAACPKPLGWI